MVYRVEVWQMGKCLLEKDFSHLEKAREFYYVFCGRPDCSTELYVNGERLRYLDAWRMMARKDNGWGLGRSC